MAFDFAKVLGRVQAMVYLKVAQRYSYPDANRRFRSICPCITSRIDYGTIELGTNDPYTL